MQGKIDDLRNNFDRMAVKDIFEVTQRYLDIPVAVAKLFIPIAIAKDSHTFNKVWAVKS